MVQFCLYSLIMSDLWYFINTIYEWTKILWINKDKDGTVVFEISEKFLFPFFIHKALTREKYISFELLLPVS